LKSLTSSGVCVSDKALGIHIMEYLKDTLQLNRPFSQLGKYSIYSSKTISNSMSIFREGKVDLLTKTTI
jgi:hypothetical protein